MEQRQLIIIGSGPAGWAAATYAARAQLKPLVFTGASFGGQLMLTTEVENYPGFSGGVMGPKLMAEMQAQAERFGTEVVAESVARVDFSQKSLRLWAADTEYTSKAVIIATGAEAIPLGVPGEKEYTGRGVSYCAVCDAAFYKDKTVFVVGGGDAAMEDTLALTKFAKKVTVIHRRDSFKASKIMQDRVLVERADTVSVMWNSEVVEVVGKDNALSSIRVKDVVTGEVQELAAEGVFVAIGHKPATGFLGNSVALNEKGYVLTGLNGLWDSAIGEGWLSKYPTMTSVSGVFAGGDNVDFRYRQAVTAAGMGTMAALDAEWWLERG